MIIPNRNIQRTPNGYKFVSVISVDRSNVDRPLVHVVDRLTRSSMTIQLSMSSRMYPREGENWIIARELNTWVFHSMDPSGRRPRVSNYRESMDSLVEFGLIDYEAESGNTTYNHLQSRSGAYIGEIRFFANAVYTVPHGWLVADGSPVYKWHWPLLWSVIGDTYNSAPSDLTFDLPIVFAPGNAVAMICAA